MAIKHVVTRGFIGSGSGVNFVPTLGFDIGVAFLYGSIHAGQRYLSKLEVSPQLSQSKAVNITLESPDAYRERLK